MVLPEPEVESIAELTDAAHGYQDLFGYREPEELTWISDRMILARKQTQMVGRSGIGKPTMALYIASSVSKGVKPFAKDAPLSGDLFSSGARVLIYKSKDDWHATVAVRLDMLGATSTTSRRCARNDTAWSTASIGADAENKKGAATNFLWTLSFSKRTSAAVQ